MNIVVTKYRRLLATGALSSAFFPNNSYISKMSRRPSVTEESPTPLDHLEQHLEQNQRNSVQRTSSSSVMSFKHWHRQMQIEHERMRKSSFLLWKWCYLGCKPCRWFDKIDYEKKMCKCCLRFKTFKTLGTILLMAAFFYIFMFSIYKKEVLPGGTIFFLFLLFLIAYFAGYLAMLIGLPTIIGHLATGILLENLPFDFMLPRDEEVIEKLAQILEEVFLVIALIRAGLLLDFSRIKNRIRFIIRLAVFPVSSELVLNCVFGHYVLNLPWSWGFLQGSAISIISLATLISIMEKNRVHGYGEDKHLSTVLIAASALNVIFCLLLYVICVECLFPEGGNPLNFWSVVLAVVTEVCLGSVVGAVSGVLIAFFPDKRNAEAAALRILITGIGSFAIANVFHQFSMSAAGALGCLTMCIVAGNMWEELGWHKITNPVQYFYTMTYYFGQPVVISLVGFTMSFSHSDPKAIGFSLIIILIGLVGRSVVCFFSTWGSLYPTTLKEKVFICIAWCSKGTFQALLTFAVKYMILDENKNLDETTKQDYLYYSSSIKETTILGILFTTPIVSYGLNILSPKLLTKSEADSAVETDEFEDAYRLGRYYTGVRFAR